MADGTTPVAVSIPFPTGQNTTNLYNWAVSLSAQLRQVLQSVGGGNVNLDDLQADVTALQEQADDLQSQIDSLVSNGDLTPQQAFELSLVTRADEIFGSMTGLMELQKTQMQHNADAVMTAAIQAAKANTGVRTTVRVMNEQNLALAERIDTVEADLGVTNANVTDLTQAVADGDSSLASQISNVSTSVAGNTAAIAIVAQSVNGIETHYGITLNAQGEIIGWFRLDGTQQGSTATFNVDNFLIGKAGTSGGTAIPVFAIQTVNGAASIALRGTVIADGLLEARMIQAGAVTADKISANSLSAISANLGTITAGIMRNPAGTLIDDIANMRRYRTDNKADLNMGDSNGGPYLVFQS